MILHLHVVQRVLITFAHQQHKKLICPCVKKFDI
jgi:hypothetical protein